MFHEIQTRSSGVDSLFGRALLIALASGIGAMILTAPVWSEDNASEASPPQVTLCEATV